MFVVHASYCFCFANDLKIWKFYFVFKSRVRQLLIDIKD